MRNRGWEKFRTILSREVVIEYKACLYFACEVFFYFAEPGNLYGEHGNSV